jgi:hypothetical protein
MPLSRLSRLAWTAIGGVIGYVPTPTSWPEALRKLRGDFSLSATEFIQPALVALFSFGWAAALFRLTFERRGILPSDLERQLLFVGCAIFAILGLSLIYFYRIRYTFDSGTLRVVLPGGYVFGNYDLQTLVSVTRTQGRVADSLTLRWESEIHRILLPASLIAALPQGDGI